MKKILIALLVVVSLGFGCVGFNNGIDTLGDPPYSSNR